MFKARGAFIAVLAFSAFAASALPATAATIGAAPVANPTVGGYVNCPWGYAGADAPGLVAVGETIVTPSATDNVLDSFSFYVTQLTDPFGQLVGEPQAITFKAYVAKWDGQTTTETVWQSAPQTLTTSPDPAQQKITVGTGGVPLTSGDQYAIYFSTEETNDVNTLEDRGCGVNSSGNNYAAGGSLIRGLGFSNTNWQFGAPEFGSPDVAFEASFSEPVTDPGGGSEQTIYAFDGFYAPVNNRDAEGNYILNGVKAGSAIPVKFSLGGDYGLDVFEAGYPQSQVIECSSNADVEGIEETVNAGSSSLSYAAGSDTYTYVWKTDKGWADSCRQLVVKFDDGTTARAKFKLR